MSKRQKNILLCVGALLLGAVLYILFRRNTWVTQLASGVVSIPEYPYSLEGFAVDCAKYYVPDLLWAFSLSCGIQSLYVPEWKGTLLSGATAFGCGIAWEILQWSDVVSGTGDFWDVLMYFIGSILTILLNIKERKENEEV